MQGSGTHVYVSEPSHKYELTSFANSTAHQHTSIAVRIKLGTCTDQPRAAWKQQNAPPTRFLTPTAV